MKIPIYTFDAKTAILCTKCETKLRSGQLTDADIEGAIKITKLAQRNQDINKFAMYVNVGVLQIRFSTGHVCYNCTGHHIGPIWRFFLKVCDKRVEQYIHVYFFLFSL
jgi:hypothetical protein